MPAIPIHPPENRKVNTFNPLPDLLQTPSGLAMVEIQGTIHTPPLTSIDGNTNGVQEVKVGNLIFPLYNAETPEDNGWMKLVYLYIGQHQRLTGQVKKLPKAMAVIRRKDPQSEELLITEIIKYNIVFSQRPEPVGEE
jgi:chromosome transmission fidelity protein 8